MNIKLQSHQSIQLKAIIIDHDWDWCSTRITNLIGPIFFLLHTYISDSKLAIPQYNTFSTVLQKTIIVVQTSSVAGGCSPATQIAIQSGSALHDLVTSPAMSSKN